MQRENGGAEATVTYMLPVGIPAVTKQPPERMWFREGRGLKGNLLAPLSEPQTFFAGCVAGLAGRAAVLPIDWSPHRGAVAAVGGRALYNALLFGLYVPTLRHAQINNEDQAPMSRARRVAVVGCYATFVARFATIPFRQVQDAAKELGMRRRDVAVYMRRGDLGMTSFFITQHAPAVCAVYMAATFLCFEALRRVAETSVLRPLGLDSSLAAESACHAVLGGAATAIGSSATYRLSLSRYASLTAHTNTLEQGLRATLKKEVPMAMVTFYVFTLVHGLVSPRIPHGGFGA